MAVESVESVEDLNELRVTPVSTGKIYYVKNHSSVGDKGGGFFKWRTDPIFYTGTGYFTVDNNGTLIKSTANSGNNQGMWVRQYTGYINILFFGATTDTAQVAIQAAIDFANNNILINNAPTIGATVFIPNGAWIIDHINLFNGVEIIGDSQDKTIIYPESTDKGGSTAAMFTIPVGGPVKLAISNLNILGDREVDAPDSIPKKICFHFKAQTDGDDGGLWQSNFKRIEISKFKDHCIFLEGIDEDLPNQLLYFEHVYTTLDVSADYTVCALKITGQTGQVTFINCGFGGYNDNGAYHNGHIVSIAHRQECVASFPSVISFITCSIQNGDYGVYIDYAESITFDTCWFERLGVAITVDGSDNECRNINVLNNRFADAAGYGSQDVEYPNITAGTIVNIINSLVSVENNFVTVSDVNSDRLANDFFVTTTALVSINPGVRLAGNGFATQILARTDGVMQVITVSSNAVVTKGNTIVYVDTSIDIINTIESTLGIGETIHIRANGGSIDFDNTGNLFLTLRSFLTLQNGEIASFTRIDPTLFQLTSLVTSSTP
jgi:hypothetical protein